MDPSLFSVTYHISENDAELGTGAIPNPASYTSESGTIYIRVTNNATGCYDVVELELIVNPLPVVTNPTPLSLCDVNNPGDEIEEFDLTTKIDEITNGVLGLNVTFHTTFDDAQANTNAIPEADTFAYENLSTVQTLFVRVTDAVTGCYRVVLLDIRVEPLPIILEPTEEDLTVCDTNGEGIGTFNLTELVEDMVNNGGDDLSIRFYETAEDAELGINWIENPESYQNVIPYIQTIYVTVANADTGCASSVYELTLHVDEAPQAPTMPNIVDCDEDTQNQNGQYIVDLTQNQQLIYDAVLEAGEAEDSLIIRYFTSEANADAGTPWITNPTTYTATNEQAIWVRVEDAVTGCYSLTSFEVIINAPVAVVRPTPLVVCNEALPNDGMATFDLTTKNDEILGPQGIGNGNTVTYYETNADAQAGTSPILTPEAYTNPDSPVQNPKTLFVVVTTTAGCKSYTTLTVRVLPLPVPNFNPAPLAVCDTDTDDTNTEVFDLTQASAEILANDTLSGISYHTTLEDAEAGINAITPANA